MASTATMIEASPAQFARYTRRSARPVLLAANPNPPMQPPLPLAPLPPLLPTAARHGSHPPGELRQRAGRFMQAVAEVICGERPARQLGAWLCADVLDQLTRTTAPDTGTRHSSQRRARRMPGGGNGTGKIVSVHVTMNDPTVAEVTARMVVGDRSHAVAARLKCYTDLHGQSTWRCTALCWA